MLAISKRLFQEKVQSVVDSVIDAAWCRLFGSKKTRRARERYASKLVDRVKAVLNKHETDGCVESDFTTHFKLDEMDLVVFTLHALWKRSVVKREIRYYIRPQKRGVE